MTTVYQKRPDKYERLGTNLEALRVAADETLKTSGEWSEVGLLYHRILLECADRISVKEFAKCIRTAREIKS